MDTQDLRYFDTQDLIFWTVPNAIRLSDKSCPVAVLNDLGRTLASGMVMVLSHTRPGGQGWLLQLLGR